MNLIEARKQAHEGWVRSPTCTLGQWCRATPWGFETENGSDGTPLCAKDLDAEDWEPRPKPVEPFEAEVWVHAKNNEADILPAKQPKDSVDALLRNNWRKIRVREVVEATTSTPSPAVATRGAMVWSNSKQAYVWGTRCHKCGGTYADVWCCSTAMGGS